MSEPKCLCTLTDQLYEMQTEVARLQKAIDDCPHEYVEEEAAFAAHSRTAGPPVWAHCQFRYCKTCGLEQKRVRLNPNCQWTSWQCLSEAERQSRRGD